MRWTDEEGIIHIDNVEIVATGIEYQLSTGPRTFTMDDLADAVAAQDDPAIRSPRIKLGHSSEYNEGIGDAEPAFGRVENMRLGHGGHVIYGDYVGVPEWLASVLPVAYPSRSVEAYGPVQTVTGKEYTMIIADVSLLGVRWPGCTVLEDLPLNYGAEIPNGVEIDVSEEVAAGGSMKERNGATNAAADIDQIRRKFNKEVAVGDRYWWWPRVIRFDNADGLYMIVDDEENGDLYRMDVSVTGDNIDFGDPQAVSVEYPKKDAAVKAALIAGMTYASNGTGRTVVYASRDESRPEDNEIQGGTGMDEATRQALASRLGLPEDATEEQINAEIDRLRTAPEGATTPPATAPAGNPGAGQHGTGTVTQPENVGTLGPNQGETPPPYPPTGSGPAVVPPEEPPDPTDASGPVTLDRDTFNRLMRGAALAEQHEATNAETAMATILDDAIRAGKFAPARREHYKKLLAADFVGTKAMIASLEPGMLPVGQARGGVGSDVDLAAGGDDGLGLPAGWFPEIEARKQAMAQPSASRIMLGKEG